MASKAGMLIFTPWGGILDQELLHGPPTNSDLLLLQLLLLLMLLLLLLH